MTVNITMQYYKDFLSIASLFNAGHRVDSNAKFPHENN